MNNNKDSGFVDPHKKVDDLLKKKELAEGKRFKSAEAQRIYDNIDFGDKVEHDPVLNNKFDKKVLGYETVNFNHYINQRIWPRSIYTTDKLVRLAMSAKLEFLKRYLAKKRHVPIGMIWLLIIIFAVIIGIMVIFFLLPSLGVM